MCDYARVIIIHAAYPDISPMGRVAGGVSGWMSGCATDGIVVGRPCINSTIYILETIIGEGSGQIVDAPWMV